MTPEELEALQRKVSEMSDALEALTFSFWKKTGPASNGISNTDMESTNFETGVSGWRLDADGNLEANNGNFRGDITGATGTFSGTVTVGSLDIGGNDATSAHIDTDGNFWTGADNSSFATAPASISNAGAATFKNILIGGATIQYQVTNAGIFSFGDGSDGAAVMDGSATPTGTTKSGSDYTMTRDVYWTDATMSTGTTLNPAGYRIFGTGTLTLNGTAVIRRNGNNGADGAGINGGAGGAALADGYLKGSLAGATGGTGSNPGGDGVATTNSLGSSGVSGGAGGPQEGGGDNGAAGTPGTATLSNVKLIANWHLATLLDVSSTGATVKFNNSASSSAGGGGGRGSTAGSGGGGAGSGGGIIAIYFREIIVGASALITANGGNGGNGAVANTSGLTDGGGGGGGGGGNGGQIIAVYNVLTNSGSLTASAGTGGTGGANGGGNGSAGSNGSNGTAGTVRQFQISM